MAKYINIDKGPRGLNTTLGKVWAEPGETVDVELAKGETAPKEWFKAAGEAKKAEPQPNAPAFEAKHRGGGSYSVVDKEGRELVEKLDKDGAETFNAMDDAGKAAFIEANKKA